jgi:hypothetical protein
MKSTELFSHPALFSHPYEPDVAAKAEHDSEPVESPVFSDRPKNTDAKKR